MRQTKHSGFGGFPMPYEILSNLFGRFFPKLQRKLTRTLTIPVTTTIASQRDNVPAGAQPVPYITFDAVVGRNSTFHLLTNEQLEELGGVEYRALNALLWIVAGVCSFFPVPLRCHLFGFAVLTQYHVGIQVIAFIVIAPYMSMNRWREDFLPPNLYKPLSPAWCVDAPLSCFPSHLTLCQVFALPSCIIIYKYGDVSCRSIHGPFSTGLPHDCLYDVVDSGW